MNQFSSCHYKEVDPVNTVKRIKGILKNLDIEVEEYWLPKSKADTYSLRLTIKGCSIGTNGKGWNKNYAMASAYAEFMERLQNGWLLRYYYKYPNENGFYKTVDEKLLSAREIVEQNSSFIDFYMRKRKIESASNMEKEIAFSSVQKLDYYFIHSDQYITIPFCNITTKQMEYLPYFAYSSYYGSNGMCAGNTKEEALIQGLAEIMERYVQRQLFDKKYVLPDIPMDYIQKYPEIFSIYQKIQQIEGYYFKLKDCSLGGRYPVAALFVIQKNTGYYGVKLGCHPDYGIAMERTLTEAAQGSDITEYAGRSILDPNNEIVFDEINIENSYKTGEAQFPFELLLDTPSFEFVPMPDVSNLNSREILDYMMNKFLEDNYNILIRDVTYLSFPAYHIIIPGISEMTDMTDQRFKLLHMKYYVAELLKKPEQINSDNCRVIINVLENYSRIHNENSMSSLYGLFTNIQVPGEEFGLGWLYLVSMCYAFLEEYEKAAMKMSFFLQLIQHKKQTGNTYYLAVYYYLIFIKILKSHKTVVKYLEQFFDSGVLDKINDIFEEHTSLIVKQYSNYSINCKQSESGTGSQKYNEYISIMEKVKLEQLDSKVSQDTILKSY